MNSSIANRHLLLLNSALSAKILITIQSTSYPAVFIVFWCRRSVHSVTTSCCQRVFHKTTSRISSGVFPQDCIVDCKRRRAGICDFWSGRVRWLIVSMRVKSWMTRVLLSRYRYHTTGVYLDGSESIVTSRGLCYKRHVCSLATRGTSGLRPEVAYRRGSLILRLIRKHQPRCRWRHFYFFLDGAGAF